MLNLGHGVLVGTPEESVAHFFETDRNTLYKDPLGCMGESVVGFVPRVVERR